MRILIDKIWGEGFVHRRGRGHLCNQKRRFQSGGGDTEGAALPGRVFSFGNFFTVCIQRYGLNSISGANGDCDAVPVLHIKERSRVDQQRGEYRNEGEDVGKLFLLTLFTHRRFGLTGWVPAFYIAKVILKSTCYCDLTWKVRGAGSISMMRPSRYSRTDRPRSAMPSLRKRKMPSTPAKPFGFMRAEREKSTCPFC